MKGTNNFKTLFDSSVFNHNPFPTSIETLNSSQSDRFSPSAAYLVCPLVEVLMNSKMAERGIRGETTGDTGDTSWLIQG